MKILKITILLIFITSAHNNLVAQGKTTEQLAIQYFQNDEFEKALEIFEELFKSDPSSSYYYSYYMNCLLKLEDYNSAEKELKKLTRKYPENPEFAVDYGYVYKLLENEKKSKSTYEKIIRNLPRNESLISRTANAFYTRDELNYAISTYIKGRKILSNPIIFDFTLANLYRLTGETDKMMNEFLNILIRSPEKLESIEDNLQELVMQDKYYTQIKASILQKIQQSSYKPVYMKLLSWMFLQRKDFEEAFKQLKALDRRFKSDNSNLIQLAGVCISNRAYSVAEEIYQYILDKGQTTPYYLHAKFGVLDVAYQKIKNHQYNNISEVTDLEREYTVFLNKHFYQYKEISEKLILRLCELKAVYLDKVPEAINLLNKYLSVPHLTKSTKAKMKLDLGDYYIMYGNIWEAILTYKQVDHMYRDHPLGHQAKFRNARLSFFRGDFNWANDELDVLKASTSELIANDALYLSLLIQDNLGLDTTDIPLGKYARADFYIFKNDLDSADIILDSILTIYPGHSLTDEVYFSKGKIEQKKGNFEKAIEYYRKVYEEFPEDIIADDALFKSAGIYDKILNLPLKARELYEDLIFNYPESVFVVKARERYRDIKAKNPD